MTLGELVKHLIRVQMERPDLGNMDVILETKSQFNQVGTVLALKDAVILAGVVDRAWAEEMGLPREGQ